MRADVNTIQVAMAGRWSMLRAVVGGPEPEPAARKGRKSDRAAVAQRVKLATKAHNRNLEARKAAKAAHAASKAKAKG